MKFCSALSQVTSCGDRGEAVNEDDEGRERLLDILGQVVTAFNGICHAAWLMGAHCRLPGETPGGSLSKGMRRLNGAFTQARSGVAGRVWKGLHAGRAAEIRSRCCEGQWVISFAAIDAMRMDLAFRSGGSRTPARYA
ncbi:MAG: hypothetical protein KIT32_05160 [Rhodocyclaceae bacterium]|nr:hypothetical protein [Rhodocyclaceae bacterium]